MKNVKYLVIIVISLVFLLQCESRTYEEISETVIVTNLVKYDSDVKPIIQNNCMSCHAVSGAAAYYPLTTYAETKNAINNIIDRIERPSGDPSKMPQGGTLSQSQIDVIKKWKTDGLLEN